MKTLSRQGMGHNWYVAQVENEFKTKRDRIKGRIGQLEWELAQKRVELATCEEVIKNIPKRIESDGELS